MVLKWRRVTGTKMATSKLRNEIEQPQVFFYFPKDKKMFTSAYLSSVLFLPVFFLHFPSMKTQRVNYESCSYRVCASFVVATRRRYWRRFVSSRAFEDRRWWSVCVCEYSVTKWTWAHDIEKLDLYIQIKAISSFLDCPVFRGSSPASYWVNDVKVSSAFGGEVKSGADIFVKMFSLLKYLILVMY